MATEIPYPKIAIIGAGPSGLTLASILQRNGIPVTIFELDSNSENRDQGGSLDLHPKTGQAALRAAGLLNEFRKYARPEGDCEKVLASDGKILFDENVQDAASITGKPRVEYGTTEKESGDFIEGRPEIDRGKLRAILLDSLKAGTIQWNKKLIKVEPSNLEHKSGCHNLYFSDGAIESDFDLVIGGDGAWSKVRPLLTSAKPFYSGISGIELWALSVNEKNPWLSSFVGNGTLFSFGQDRATICQRNGSVGKMDSIRVLACVRKPEDWFETCGIDWRDEVRARERFAEECFWGCGDEIKRAIVEAGDNMSPRKLYMLPVGLEWEGKKGLTLMGDAAHLMTPFAGVGVNVAMADAMDLGEKIVKWRIEGVMDEGLEGLVREYEKEMFVRGKFNAELTMKGLEGHFSAGGSEKRAMKLKQRAEMRAEMLKVKG